MLRTFYSWLLHVASVYFNLIPMLKSLDADGDFVISPWEIVAAPSALRRLDLNHDGEPGAEECGFSSGPRPQDAPDPEFMREAKTIFMRSHPTIAALDADHDARSRPRKSGRVRDSCEPSIAMVTAS